MKTRGYIVRVEADRVTVEHRASFRPLTIVCMAAAYLCYCLLPGVRKILIDFYYSRDPVIGGFALLMLLIPILSGATWLFFASGEVMRCDAHELHVARRRTWSRWRRSRFFSPQVRELHRASRGTGRSRNYTVLTFQYEGRAYDMLEDLSSTDSDRVLKACKSMGLRAIVTVDEGAAMLRDIEQRGWFINPLRADQNESDSKGIDSPTKPIQDRQ
jgi:hypothetical protein